MKLKLKMLSFSMWYLLLLILYLTSFSVALTPQNAHKIHQPQQQQYTFLSHQIYADNDTAFSPGTSVKREKNSESNESSFLKRQVVAGGGIPATTLPPSQYPTVTFAGSLFTVGTSTSATWKEFTQTFATTALGTWALGPTPRIGTIGLGTIKGTVGVVKSAHKRTLQTPSPQV
ncbi:putative secreted effector protein [Golovinomyces cichoracearum]|uniref:Putative secreted effector protein n=1 Tax=Golovinomyces cichoracearum TaxID=62708 RepID=A0A420J9A5_9PEZI|nr:putative secreted effector protein [Golovinomyces cichoracearum]